jgi:DNA-binding transcriptional ArsR family regulator
MLSAMNLIRKPSQAAALLQPERARLLEALDEPGSAATLARRFSLPRQRLNYHLRELEKLGLVEFVEERRRGNCVERLLRATARSYVVSPEVLGALGRTRDAVQDRFSASYLVAAASRIVGDLGALAARAAKEDKRLATLTLESRIRFRDPDARARFAEELAAELARLGAKYHDDEAPGGRTFRVVAASYPAVEEKR